MYLEQGRFGDVLWVERCMIDMVMDDEWMSDEAEWMSKCAKDVHLYSCDNKGGIAIDIEVCWQASSSPVNSN